MLFQKIFVDVYGPSEHSFQLSNLLLTISLMDFQLFEWLGPIGMCNFSSVIYCLYFTGSDLYSFINMLSTSYNTKFIS